MFQLPLPRGRRHISNWHNACASLRNPMTLKWSDCCVDIALILANQWNTYDLPYSLVDIRKEVKHEKNDWKNFTNQADDVCGVSVLSWIVLSWTIDQRIGQNKKENNVQWSLKTTKKGRRRQRWKRYIQKRARWKLWKSAKFARGHEIRLSEMIAVFLFIYLFILFLADLLTHICFCFLYVQVHCQHYSNKKKRRNTVPEINSNLNRMQLPLRVEKPRKHV